MAVLRNKRIFRYMPTTDPIEILSEAKVTPKPSSLPYNKKWVCYLIPQQLNHFESQTKLFYLETTSLMNVCRNPRNNDRPSYERASLKSGHAQNTTQEYDIGNTLRVPGRQLWECIMLIPPHNRIQFRGIQLYGAILMYWNIQSVEKTHPL